MNKFHTPWHIGYNLDCCEPMRWPTICDCRNCTVILPETEIVADGMLPIMEYIIACVNLNDEIKKC